VTSGEPWIEHEAQASATEEQYLEFLASLEDLARSEHLDAETRLHAIHYAIDSALGNGVVKATDWAQRVALRLLEP
jgi:hypothetical protein